MAGAKQEVTVSIDDKAIRAALTKAIKRASNLSPALKTIGEGMVLSTRERIEDQVAPDGSSWKPLSPLTLALKSAAGLGSKILIGEGNLKDEIVIPPKNQSSDK